MPYNDEPQPSVDLRAAPVLYTHDQRPVYRQIGFRPAPRLAPVPVRKDDPIAAIKRSYGEDFR